MPSTRPSATDPALFAEILSYIYCAEGEPPDEDVPPERRAIAMVGYTVIRAWHTPPGVRPDGTVDADALRDLGDRGPSPPRRVRANRRRGPRDRRVLAYVPPDTDGLWPAEAVRDLVEDLRSPKSRRVFTTASSRAGA